MISKYDVIRQFHNAEKKGKVLSLKLSEDENSLIDSNTGEFVCSVDTFTEKLRKQEHCDFETIYYEHATLVEVYRCRQCGTVIFGGDDEYHYNPNERCPTCCQDESVCYNKYWTKEQIDSDLEKQKTIQSLIEMQKEMNEADKRRKARGGLYDWQRWRKELPIGSRVFKCTLINYNSNKKLEHTDRFLEVCNYKKSDGIVKYCFQIPLSFYHIYIRYIFPYSKKCRPELRKYYFWQKKIS